VVELEAINFLAINPILYHMLDQAQRKSMSTAPSQTKQKN